VTLLSGNTEARKRPRVVVIGGTNMDIKCRIAGRATMASSNPGNAVLTPGGVARNIAENLARLGVAASLISAVGRDRLGEQLIRETADAGVDVRGVMRATGATGLYAATLDARGELIVGVAAMAIVERLTPRRLQRQRPRIAAADLVVADSNLPAATLDWLIDVAVKHDVRLAIETVSVPKGGKLRRLLRRQRQLFALFCSRDEARALTARQATRAAVRALHDMGVRHVCVGLGRGGMAVSSGDDGRTTVPAIPARIVDVTGAGDAAVAGTLLGLLRGEPLPVAARYGQAAAALTVTCDRSVNPQLSVRAISRCIRNGRPSP
jgi:pseudouridine kinase